MTGVSFASAKRAVVVGYQGTILQTDDGGVTWQRLNSFVSTDLFSVFFTDELHGWASGDGGVVLTTGDGGTIWLPVNVRTSPKLTTLFFADESLGWAAGADGLVLRTDDGGLGWRRLTEGGREDLSHIFFLDNSRGWAVGSRGQNTLHELGRKKLGRAPVRHDQPAKRRPVHKPKDWHRGRRSRDRAALAQRRRHLGADCRRGEGRSL